MCKTPHVMSYLGTRSGFAGTETDLSQRDWTTNITILSGDIGTPADSTERHPEQWSAFATMERGIYDRT